MSSDAYGARDRLNGYGIDVGNRLRFMGGHNRSMKGATYGMTGWLSSVAQMCNSSYMLFAIAVWEMLRVM